ncbi:hypothetical protein BDV96DRAFT_605245 [Lophiotrema nucula]|uniref:Uncharacterized protein n=1 Tax=Lophiotrema nucula TaxID=690887 RepID=A0A6A5YP90_9PLEO|nr:hypothetical protein BDV96DRAFT_605245 [Lophiotrema nucula]
MPPIPQTYPGYNLPHDPCTQRDMIIGASIGITLLTEIIIFAFLRLLLWAWGSGDLVLKPWRLDGGRKKGDRKRPIRWMIKKLQGIERGIVEEGERRWFEGGAAGCGEGYRDKGKGREDFGGGGSAEDAVTEKDKEMEV